MPGAGTRPTSDRVRESLFGALESLSAISGARVLDLYAGSGALGLEALSRGAASADLVERGRQAAAGSGACFQATFDSMPSRPEADDPRLGDVSEGRVHESSVHAFLQRAAGPFDLVFSDPPYDLDDAAMTADLVALAPLLASDAVVVVERARRSAPPDFTAAGLELFREKSYGDTTLWWAEPSAETDGDAVQGSAAQPETESQSR